MIHKVQRGLTLPLLKAMFHKYTYFVCAMWQLDWPSLSKYSSSNFFHVPRFCNVWKHFWKWFSKSHFSTVSHCTDTGICLLAKNHAYQKCRVGRHIIILQNPLVWPPFFGLRHWTFPYYSVGDFSVLLLDCTEDPSLITSHYKFILSLCSDTQIKHWANKQPQNKPNPNNIFDTKLMKHVDAA